MQWRKHSRAFWVTPIKPGSAAAQRERRIERFGWKSYADQLIDLIAAFDGKAHYLHAPHLGLYGKAQPQERMEGLETVMTQVRGKTVLDVGAAEGFIAHECVLREAARVDAVEIDADRVAFARAAFAGIRFEHGDVRSEKVRRGLAARAPERGYDIVLYLGVSHHMPRDVAMLALRDLANLTRQTFVVRTSAEMHEQVAEQLLRLGFRLDHQSEPATGSCAGPVQIYKRVAK